MKFVGLIIIIENNFVKSHDCFTKKWITTDYPICIFYFHLYMNANMGEDFGILHEIRKCFVKWKVDFSKKVIGKRMELEYRMY